MKDELRSQLTKALQEFDDPNWEIGKFKEYPESGIVLKTSCYIAFFVELEKGRSATEICQNAENEILVARDKIGKNWPRDLNLVMLVTADIDYVEIRRLIDDTHNCRKFVLNLNGEGIRDNLYNLPFLPPGDLHGRGQPVIGKSVRKIVKGYDLNLISNLTSRSPGVDRIVESILEGKYHLTGEVPTDKIVQQPINISPIQRKLSAIEIQNFRGIKNLSSKNMPLNRDIVLIYGPNGVGKTSIAQAVEWAITGQVERLNRDQTGSAGVGYDPIVNVFSDNEEVSVTCYMGDDESFSRRKQGRSVERFIGDRKVNEDRAIIDYVVGSKAPSRFARLGIQQLRDLFRGSHMLSQHSIRQFLEKSSPNDKFDILTKMIGAEAFVRFRNKVISVANVLNSHINTKKEIYKSLSDDNKHALAKLDSLKKEYDRLKKSITYGKGPEELAHDLIEKLQKSDCVIDEAALKKESAEHNGNQLELIAIHIENVIRNKNNDNIDLKVRLKGMEQDLPGFIEAQEHCKILRDEIINVKNTLEKEKSNLHNLKDKYKDMQDKGHKIQTEMSESVRNFSNLTWLKENLSNYIKYKDSLKSLEINIKDLRNEIDQSEAAFCKRRLKIVPVAV